MDEKGDGLVGFSLAESESERRNAEQKLFQVRENSGV